MKKTIELTLEQARELLGKDESMDVLIRANFTEQELKGRVAKWEDLGKIEGWWISAESNIFSRDIDKGIFDREERNVFAKKTQAEGVLAMAQLSQLMKQVNGDWKPDWKSDNIKYVIEIHRGRIDTTGRTYLEQFLVFPTSEICDQFLSDHRELIKEYFKIYE